MSLFTRPRFTAPQIAANPTGRSSTPCGSVPDRDSCPSRVLPGDEVTGAGQGTCSPTCQLLPPALPAYGGGHGAHLPRSGLSSAAAPAAGPRWRLCNKRVGLVSTCSREAPQTAALTAAHGQAQLSPVQQDPGTKGGSSPSPPASWAQGKQGAPGREGPRAQGWAEPLPKVR